MHKFLLVTIFQGTKKIKTNSSKTSEIEAQIVLEQIKKKYQSLEESMMKHKVQEYVLEEERV
jgi:hypothetical protein